MVTIRSLMVFVADFPEEERRAALARLIDLWEEAHIGLNTPMPLLLHLIRHDLESAYGEGYPGRSGRS
jgi:hypothetical protein